MEAIQICEESAMAVFEICAGVASIVSLCVGIYTLFLAREIRVNVKSVRSVRQRAKGNGIEQVGGDKGG